jgi:hypothetical protein
MAKKKPEAVVAQDVAAQEEVSDIAQDAGAEEEQSEKLVTIDLPCWVRVNNKEYGPGRVEVSEHLGRLLREMAHSRVERERNVFIGNKYEVDRTLTGGSRVRKTGTLGGG